MVALRGLSHGPLVLRNIISEDRRASHLPLNCTHDSSTGSRLRRDRGWVLGVYSNAALRRAVSTRAPGKQDMNETSKCRKWRDQQGHFDRYLTGKGIDVGAGLDALTVRAGHVRAWDK